MAKLSPQALAAKWSTKVQGSTQAYKDGIAGVTENPAAKAAAASDLWIARLNEAHQDGRFQDGLAKVTLQGWKTAATEKGATNLAAGARLGAIKVQQAEQIMGPQRDAIVASLPARGTLDQNIERMTQMARGMAATRKRR